MLENMQFYNSNICYDKCPSPYTAEYYWYCTKLLAEAAAYSGQSINVIMGDYSFDFQNDKKTFKFDIQPEHTLVKLGGRSVDNIIYGDIDTEEGDKYLVRIQNYDYYKNLDCVIEYSIPNLVNIESASVDFSEYLKKNIYIAPALYTYKDIVDFDQHNKRATVTMFSTNSSPRRTNFLYACDNVQNVQGMFSAADLKGLYKRTRIMVNVHQTDHHHTFEELRCLPALQNGVIIVSEDVPLKHKIPYGDHIVWAKYGDLIDTVKEVQDNYEEYYNKIFNEGLRSIIVTLQENNLTQFEEMLCTL